MNQNEIVNKLKLIVAKTMNQEIEEQNLDLDLVEHIGINSIDAISILVEIEDEFGIEVEDEDLSSELVRTIRSLVEYIEKRI